MINKRAKEDIEEAEIVGAMIRRRNSFGIIKNET